MKRGDEQHLVPLAAFAVACLLLAAASACNPTTRYKVLSFFFDGVPDPNAPPPARGGSRMGGRSSGGQPLVLHAPYAEQRCSACHGEFSPAGFGRGQVREEICLTCHAKTPTQYAVMHGPVAAKACMFCHSPHSSPHKHLLKAPMPKACVQCHDAALLSPMPVEHTLPNVDCLLCHMGHGGNQRHFLRFATTRPAPAPATGPAGGSSQ